MVKLYNSLSRKIEEFKPIKKNKVGLYTCGPTVYNFAHIGNLRTYIFEDVLKRTLLYNTYEVDHVMNITDVGHLTSDADEGEDKLEKGARRESKNVQEIIEFYTQAFLTDLKKLNILDPDELPYASKHVPDQIEIIKILERKGFTYETPEAIYFDVIKFPDYTKLSWQKLEEKMTGARKEVIKDNSKRNPADFALWFKLMGRFKNHSMHWPSPWGEGFPGWHIECSAMSKKYLGQPFDIHASGIDHLPIHHTNEIAQSEAAFDKPLANYWIHGEHLLINEGRMGKSEGNFLILDDLIKKGYNPLAFRYLVLTAHYRSQLNFTFESLTAAQNALNNLYSEISSYEKPNGEASEFENAFLAAINNDLDTPKAIATVWDLIRSELPSRAKLKSLFVFDKVLGLNIEKIYKASQKIPSKVKKLIKDRKKFRADKNFNRADKIRKEIESMGYSLEDTPEGLTLKKKF